MSSDYCHLSVPEGQDLIVHIIRTYYMMDRKSPQGVDMYGVCMYVHEQTQTSGICMHVL